MLRYTTAITATRRAILLTTRAAVGLPATGAAVRRIRAVRVQIQAVHRIQAAAVTSAEAAQAIAGSMFRPFTACAIFFPHP